MLTMTNPMKQDASNLAIKPQTAKLHPSESAIAENNALIGGYAYQIIRRQSKRVFKLRSPVLADSDPENLHQMRIGTRRLRSALLLFTDTIEIEGTTPAALSKSVQKLTKVLGKVRDIDVMQQWFTQMLETASASQKTKKGKDNEKSKPTITSSIQSLSKQEEKAIRSLLKTLKKRRKKKFSRMASTLSAPTYKKVAKQCKQWTKKPKFSPVAQQPAASNAIQKMIEPLTQLLQHPSWEIATKPLSATGSQRRVLRKISLAQLNQQLEKHGDQLHDLRKQIKNVRYQTEFFRSLYGIHYAAQVRELRTLQSVLGQLQDQLVVSEFLTKELGSNWPERLPTIYEAFQSSRLDLWHQWQSLQGKYLGLHEQLKTQKNAAQLVA